MELFRAMNISAAGMEAQTTRLRVVAENLANRDTTGDSPGADPYRRKTVSFENRLDRATGLERVRVKKVEPDMSALPQRFDPSHPAADERGYIRAPNVNSFIEMMDMREAQRSYSANLAVLEVSKGMLQRAIDILR
jgi:flagellar basal-body rod protein FlgC